MPDEVKVSAFEAESGKTHVSRHQPDNGKCVCSALVPLNFSAGFRPHSIEQITCKVCYTWLKGRKKKDITITFE